jgi:hypothetical protein
MLVDFLKKKPHLMCTCGATARGVERKRKRKNSCAHELQLQGGRERRKKKKTRAHELQLQGGGKRRRKKKKQILCTRAASGTKQYAGHVHINASNRQVQKKNFEATTLRTYNNKKIAAHVHMSCYH